MRRDSMFEIAKFDLIGGDKFPKFQMGKISNYKRKTPYYLHSKYYKHCEKLRRKKC